MARNLKDRLIGHSLPDSKPRDLPESTNSTKASDHHQDTLTAKNTNPARPNLSTTAAAFARFLNSDPTPQEILERGVSDIARAVGATHGEVLDLRSTANGLALLAGHGFAQEMVGKRPKNSGPYDSFAGYCLHLEQDVIYAKDFDHVPFHIPGLLQANNIQSAIGAKVHVGGDLCYLLTALSPEKNAFSNHQIRFLSDMAGQVSRMLETSKLREECLSLRNQNTMTGALLGHLSTARGPEDVLDRVARLLVGLTPDNFEDLPHGRLADVCAIDLVSQSNGEKPKLKRLTMKASNATFLESFDQRELPTLTPNAGPGKVIHTGEPELKPVIEEPYLRAIARDEEHYKNLLELDPKSYICVPLTVGGSVLGCIGLISNSPRRIYNEDWARFARMLSQLVANLYASRMATSPAASYTTSQNASLAPAKIPAFHDPDTRPLPDETHTGLPELDTYIPTSERLIFNLFTEEKQPRDVKQQLHISPSSYDGTVRRLVKRLGMKNVFELREYARKADPIP